MVKAIKTPKQPKEPVRVRYKTLSDGSQSVYLDIYRDGKRQYEFLKLYLIPETNAAAKAQNKATLAAVNTIKSQRIIELTNGVAAPPNVLRWSWRSVPLSPPLSGHRQDRRGPTPTVRSVSGSPHPR